MHFNRLSLKADSMTIEGRKWRESICIYEFMNIYGEAIKIFKSTSKLEKLKHDLKAESISVRGLILNNIA